MASKRKDSRGIILKQGETQIASGRYRYRYFDSEGKAHDVYSWRLRPEDPTPEGKKPAPSLRELEKQIRRDLDDNLKAWQGNMTLNQLIQEYMKEQKDYWSPGTLTGYEYTFGKHIEQKIGKKKVSKITRDDVEKFYKSLLQDKENPLKLSSVCTLDKLVNPALQLAVRKNLIRINPAEGIIGQLKKKCPESLSESRHALEIEQQEKLLDFIKNDSIYSVYYSMFYLLAWTGCRINELLALTWHDVDFQKEVIYIRRSLCYKKIDGAFQFYLKEPKTRNGTREIPMLADVKSLLQDMRGSEYQKIVFLRNQEVTLQDLSVFIFKNKHGNVYDYSSIDHKLRCIVKRYNQANKEKMPSVSCHIFRHSFCCWLCENIEGTNSADDIKYIQSIMGHSDAATTLNIYSELRKGNQEGKHEALKKKAIAR